MFNLNHWREQNGLDYNGWKMFLFKKFLRKIKLDFLIPFQLYMGDYHEGVLEIVVCKWGKQTNEAYKWTNYDAEVINKLRENGITNHRQFYKIIKSLSTKEVS